MKAVDSTIKIGGIIVAHSDDRVHELEQHGAAAGVRLDGMDFASVHWYAGHDASPRPRDRARDGDPEAVQRARAALGTASYDCTGGADMPIAITEWGPNTNSAPTHDPDVDGGPRAGRDRRSPACSRSSRTRRFMDQGAMAAHWLELHNNSYLAGIDATNDPFTMVNDSPRWGYHGRAARALPREGGDQMVQAAQSGTFGAALKTHASVHANGDIAVMMTNTNRNYDANVTLNVTGGNLGCVGKRYAYTPVNTDQDGGLTGDWIFANTPGRRSPCWFRRTPRSSSSSRSSNIAGRNGTESVKYPAAPRH